MTRDRARNIRLLTGPLLPRIAIALGTVLALAVPVPGHAQRRGAPGAAVGPLTAVSVTMGGAEYRAEVDADCHVDERATTGNTRAYFVARYPWFGQRVAANKPQWRFDLSIRKSARPDRYDEFVFSFQDGAKSGTIQTVRGAERMGVGTVRVARQGAGARFEVAGRSQKGDTIRAVINCSALQQSEGAGG